MVNIKIGFALLIEVKAGQFVCEDAVETLEATPVLALLELVYCFGVGSAATEMTVKLAFDAFLKYVI